MFGEMLSALLNALFSPQRSRRKTRESKKLARHLTERGWRPELEKWDGHKHIDIAVVECRVNIEVDGKQHAYSARQALADLERTYYSFEKGYTTLRIPNILIRNSWTIDSTVDLVDKFLRVSAEQVESRIHFR